MPFDEPDHRTDAVERALSVASVHRRQGDYEAAWRALDDALAMAPEWAPVIELMGDLSLDQGDYEAAAQCYRRALQIEPRRATAEVGLGRALVLAQAEAAPVTYDPVLERRQPSTAAALSVFIPGLGQAYANELGAGLAFFAGVLMLWIPLLWVYTSWLELSRRSRGAGPGILFWLVLLLVVAVHVWSAADAWTRLERARAGRAEP